MYGFLIIFRSPRGVSVRFTHAGRTGTLAAVLALDGGETLEIEQNAEMLITRTDGAPASEAPARPAADGTLLLQEVDTVRGDPLYYSAIAATASGARAP